MAEAVSLADVAADLLKQRMDSANSRVSGLAAYRADSYWNPITGVGGPNDKRISGIPYTTILSYEECAELYRGNDMAARIIDAPAEEMCRRGWEVTIQDDEQQNQKGVELSEQTSAYVDNLDELNHVLQAIKWARAYGGAGIFIGANDGQEAFKPLNYNNIKSIDFLLTLDKSELVANSYYTDFTKPNFGYPETYRLNRFGAVGFPAFGASRLGALQSIVNIISLTGSSRPLDVNINLIPVIHESRILRFEGIIINRLQLREQYYWGDSVLNRAYDVLRDFDLSWSSAAVLLQDFAQAVYKLPGFAALLAKEGPTAFAQAAAMIERSRSTARAIFMDKEDEFERKSTPTTGLPELLLQFCRRLSAAADMPMSRLMGDSPRGFNASGETDETWWYDKIAAMQKTTLLPPLKKWYKMVFACKTGPTEGKVLASDNWKVGFLPLKQLSDLQEADRRFRIGQTDAVMVGAGVYTSEEIALTRSGGDQYNGGKVQLQETDPKKREDNRVEMVQKMNVRGAIGAASTNPGFDQRKTEVHLGTPGGNIPPVSSGSSSDGGSTRGDSGANFVPPLFIPASAEFENEEDEINLIFQRFGKKREDWNFEIIRSPSGKMVGIFLIVAGLGRASMGPPLTIDSSKVAESLADALKPTLEKINAPREEEQVVVERDERGLITRLLRRKKG